MVAAHLRVGIVVGVLVDQLDDHVVVGAGGGGKDVGDHFAGDDQILLEYRQLPHGHIFAVGDKALVFGEPVEPLRAVAIGGLDRPMTIGNRVRRIAVIAGLGRCRGVAPTQQPVAPEVQAGGLASCGGNAQ